MSLVDSPAKRVALLKQGVSGRAQEKIHLFQTIPKIQSIFYIKRYGMIADAVLSQGTYPVRIN